jgi:hypothetical protein
VAEDVLVGEELGQPLGDALRFRQVLVLERLLARFVPRVDEADELPAQVERRGEEAVRPRLEHELGEARLGGQAVHEKGGAAAAAAVGDGIVGVDAVAETEVAEAVFGDQLEAAGAVEEVERGFGRADVDRAVVEDLFQFRPKLLHLRVHGPELYALHQCTQLVDDLALCRKSPLILFGEELLIVGADDEDAAGAAHELGLDAELLPDLGRQTGGPGKVVSNAAVVDSNVH